MDQWDSDGNLQMNDFLFPASCSHLLVNNFHEELKSSNCVKQFRHTGSAEEELEQNHRLGDNDLNVLF